MQGVCFLAGKCCSAGWHRVLGRQWDRAGRAHLQHRAELRDLADADLQPPPPTPSGGREGEQKAVTMQGCPCCTQNMAEEGTIPCGWGVAPASFSPQQIPVPSLLNLCRTNPLQTADLSPSPQIKAFPCWIAPQLLLLLLLLPVSSVLAGPPSSRIIIPGCLAAAPWRSC